MSEFVPAKYLRPYWVCHFDFYDGPLTGLVSIDGQHYWAAAQYDASGDERQYHLTEIVITKECREYLDDYKKAYHHAFYTKGKRPEYDGRPLVWFTTKWQLRNPIKELAEGTKEDRA